MKRRRLGAGLRFAWLCCCWLASWPPSASAAQVERNNWAVLVDTSRYWYNYRHVANVLSFYHTIKRLGVPDSQIIMMLAEDMACNPRNARPGTVFHDMHHKMNLYGDDVEVDYRGDEVSVDNFLRLLTGRHPANTPRNKRLLTDSMSNIFIFISGHSGDEFIKFQDWEEITSTDIADAFAQMHKQRRYRKIFWMSDTCQAATLQNQFYSPGVLALGSSGKKENSYSHHLDPELGAAVIDRFTYYAFDFINRLTPTSPNTVQGFLDTFDPHLLHSHPQLRADLFGQSPRETLLTDFLASTGRMRFQGRALPLDDDPAAPDLDLTLWAAGIRPTTSQPAAAPRALAFIPWPTLGGGPGRDTVQPRPGSHTALEALVPASGCLAVFVALTALAGMLL